MNQKEHDALFDDIANLHWTLWRILSRTERGTHRMLLANADDALCEILRDMKETRPQGVHLVRRSQP